MKWTYSTLIQIEGIFCVKDNEFIRSIKRGEGVEISASLYTFIQVLIKVDCKWVPVNIKSEKL
jgi:hypothetical protein